MRVAVAAHEGRVSPVLDVARRLLVVEMRDGRTEHSRQEVPLASTALAARVRDIQAAGIAVLICGALSRPLEAALRATGIRVIPQICGLTDDVLAAFASGHLDDKAFLMPGCCGRRGRRRRGRGGGRRGPDVRGYDP